MVAAAPRFLDIIRARRAEISQQRKVLGIEDDELAIAERVAERLIGASETGATIANASMAAAPPKTQTELVISTLRASVDPWFESSGALHDEIQRIHGIDIRSGSLLPVLTSLKKERTIVRDGPKIALTSRVSDKISTESRNAKFCGAV